ncbi:MAG: diphthine--ammonia ligase [Bacteroidetes bacterium]|nr:diphthine--ammonia ligase [Bacteroidota bacterium]
MDLPKAIFCWSGGKDSALCLHKVLSQNLFDVKYLLTTVNDEFKRVSMHGTREDLLDLQASAIGLPLLKVRVKEGTNSEYEKQMEAALLKAKAEGIEQVIFGDIFLEDLRVYRENNLAKVNMKAVFPLWKKDTRVLIKEFIDLEFKTVICCVNDGYFGEEWLGRAINEQFIKELPANVDPCGENGEYHTFCFAGPVFKKEVRFTMGENIYKALDIRTDDTCKTEQMVITKGFWFCDLLPFLTT